MEDVIRILIKKRKSRTSTSSKIKSSSLHRNHIIKFKEKKQNYMSSCMINPLNPIKGKKKKTKLINSIPRISSPIFKFRLESFTHKLRYCWRIMEAQKVFGRGDRIFSPKWLKVSFSAVSVFDGEATCFPCMTADLKAVTFTVWMKSLIMQGNGLTVFNENGQVAYRIDNYDEKRSREVFLMDLRGKLLFTVRRKVGFHEQGLNITVYISSIVFPHWFFLVSFGRVFGFYVIGKDLRRRT